MWNKVPAFISLFTSFGTLLCCALPALFVTLGLGSTFAALTNSLPHFYTLTANKGALKRMFMSGMKKRLNSRVLLNNFIKMVA